ncbi:aldo/keto reductase [Alcaligenaceae bacterium]|nr:aldo/keto reductase [Alcaligenaceae bacterium]
MTTNNSTVNFHDGRSAPQLGLGVWQIENAQVTGVVRTALELGYRSIDTAAFYDNETGVGLGIRESGIPRDEIFLTTKLWNDQHGHALSRAAFETSLEKLGVDYLDLYLIHWPVPKTDLYVEAWETLIQLRDEGLIKSIGVSNFKINHLQKLLDKTGVMPVVNQIELNPSFQQNALRLFHTEQEIITAAWSPLGQGCLWDSPVLAAIAHKHQRTIAQIVLRWHVQLGNMVLTKSVSPARLQENMLVFDFKLDDDDMAAIATMDNPDGRQGPDPELFRLHKDAV